MFQNYEVAVRISLVNHVSAALAAITRQFVATDAAAAAFQRRLTSIKTMGITGAAMFGGGAALAAPFVFGISKAAEFQKQMIAIQDVTHATTDQMNAMRAAIEKIAGQTMFSNIDVAKMAKIMSTGNTFTPQQVESLLPIYARFADVQKLMKGTPYEQSVSEAVRLAHTAQHYDPQSLTAYLDLLNKASMVIPGGLSELGNALKYSQGMGKTALGIDDQNMIVMTALLNRLGFAGSRGGTNAIAAMVRSIPGVFGSGLLKGKSYEALSEMQMIDKSGHSRAFVNGKFDPVAWMGLLGQFVNKEFASKPEAIARQDIVKDFSHAFGVMGNRVTSLLASPQAIEQWKAIGAQFEAAGGVRFIQEDFMKRSVAQQWTNLQTNITSAFTELGYSLLPDVTVALNKLNSGLQQLITWMSSHQNAVRNYGRAFLALAAAMAFGGTVLLMSAAFRGLAMALQFSAIGGFAGIMGIGRALAGVSTGLTGLAGGLVPLAAILAELAVLTGEFYLVYKATRWVADKITPKDWTFGGWLYDKVNGDHNPNPGSAGVARGTIQRPGTSPSVASGRGTVIMAPVNMMLDQHKLASVMLKLHTAGLTSPQTGISDFDGLMSLAPAGSGF